MENHHHCKVCGNMCSPSQDYCPTHSTLSTELKATIPEGCRAFLDLKPSDKLEWKMDIDGETNERTLIVKKLQLHQSEGETKQ